MEHKFNSFNITYIGSNFIDFFFSILSILLMRSHKRHAVCGFTHCIN